MTTNSNLPINPFSTPENVTWLCDLLWPIVIVGNQIQAEGWKVFAHWDLPSYCKWVPVSHHVHEPELTCCIIRENQGVLADRQPTPGM